MSDPVHPVVLMEMLDKLGQRFAGVDLQRRRTGEITWPSVWRARLVTNKNERHDYRLAVYGDTWSDAVRELLTQVDRIDHGLPAVPT